METQIETPGLEPCRFARWMIGADTHKQYVARAGQPRPIDSSPTLASRSIQERLGKKNPSAAAKSLSGGGGKSKISEREGRLGRGRRRVGPDWGGPRGAIWSSRVKAAERATGSKPIQMEDSLEYSPLPSLLSSHFPRSLSVSSRLIWKKVNQDDIVSADRDWSGHRTEGERNGKSIADDAFLTITTPPASWSNCCGYLVTCDYSYHDLIYRP